MESFLLAKKPHAVCIPFPFQSHINSMLKIAKLLHFKGFHITFVNTEFNHQQLLKSGGPDSLKGFPDFQFETIPDGLPPSDINAPQDIASLIASITTNCLVPLHNLITKLNEASSTSDYPRVSCIVADCYMSLTLEAAETFHIPGVLLWTMSPSILMSYLHCQLLAEEGLIPPKDKRNSTNWYPDMPINLIPGMRDIRLRDLPSFFWDGNDAVHNICIREVQEALKASAIIIHTFDALECKVLNAIKSLLPPIYTIGPLQLLEKNIPNTQLRSLRSNLLKEDQGCLQWLDSRQPDSVVYVNFGSTTVMNSQQLIEFAWGLANCKHPFFGVPVIGWPFFADQTTNCRYACVHWGIGMEIDKNVKRDEVEGLVRQLMEGDKGKRMTKKAMEWKKSAEESTKPGGSSYMNLDKVIKEVLVIKKLD
ncbi:hypothetical protein AQUCO_03900124v1 [Aquilegia coerulea]|uniref:Glycosyltransferase N-terminal domain-containing protein n=1 Tax=Aquilegia coerulea TaxID=218851 RepID=A0A2G5CRV4_AQUCA|nr:hypothetical protein AQUCO_03900124v1 [Aquilegia coerulea]